MQKCALISFMGQFIIEKPAMLLFNLKWVVDVNLSDLIIEDTISIFSYRN